MNSEKELEIIKNNYNNSNDYYTPKGYVFCYDESGKLLFHTHNMIVKSGRELIFNALTDNGSLNLGNLTAKLGNSTSLVSADDGISSLGVAPITISSNNSSDPSYISYDANTTNLIYKYTIVYSPSNGSGIQFISTLGLIKDSTLFSRVVFPEYSATTNKLTFTYYLYF